MGEWSLQRHTSAEPEHTRSDWMTDPSLHGKVGHFLNFLDGANGTDGPTMHCGSVPSKSMGSVRGVTPTNEGDKTNKQRVGANEFELTDPNAEELTITNEGELTNSNESELMRWS